MTDIIDQLKNACVGKPAKIAWPHRLLHDSMDELTRLREENARLREAGATLIAAFGQYERKHYTLDGIVSEYWSPAARMIDTQVIDDFVKALGDSS